MRDTRRSTRCSSTAVASRRRSGLICVEIFGYRDAGRPAYAESLGIALQLTNIIRDVAVDLRRGRIYLPAEDLVTVRRDRGRPAPRPGDAAGGGAAARSSAIGRTTTIAAPPGSCRRPTPAASWPPRSWAASTSRSCTRIERGALRRVHVAHPRAASPARAHRCCASGWDAARRPRRSPVPKPTDSSVEH